MALMKMVVLMITRTVGKLMALPEIARKDERLVTLHAADRSARTVIDDYLPGAPSGVRVYYCMEDE